MKINKKIILKTTSKLLALTTISTTGMFPTSFTPRFYSSTVQAGWFTSPYDEFMENNQIKSLTAIIQGILTEDENNETPVEKRKVWQWFASAPDYDNENNENNKKVLKALQTKFDSAIGALPKGHPGKPNKFGEQIFSLTLPDVVNAYLNYVLSFRGHTLDSADGTDLAFINSTAFTGVNKDLTALSSDDEKFANLMLALQSVVSAYSTKRLVISALAAGQNIAPWILPGAGLLALSLGSGLIGKAYHATKVVLGGATNVTKEFLRRNIYNRFALDSDPLVLRKKMEDYLYSIVLCQDKALSKLINIMSGMAEMWRISDKTGEPCKTASTMVFIGDSGIGKTLTARALSELFFKRDMQPWQFITSASIAPTAVSSTDNSKDSKNKNNKNKPQDSGVMTPADRLFSADSELIRQLKLNNKVIIVLDEIDKMHALDPNDTILGKLRNARDTGTIRIKNGVDEETVDVSRTVFICISNEKRECWGLEPVKLTDVQAAARTEIKRDKSLVNRFDVIEFDYFTKEAYTVILKPLLESLQQSYRKLYNINIAIDEDLVCSIAEAAEELNKGARGVNDYMAALYGALVGYRAELLQSGLENSKENLYISAKYNRDSKSFDITQNDPDALIQNYYDSSLAC
ncbi:MAG: AAA family ATPase [Clostridia bacterium]|nr:AAA family ATPase [Clostridia bacterium]